MSGDPVTQARLVTRRRRRRGEGGRGANAHTGGRGPCSHGAASPLRPSSPFRSASSSSSSSAHSSSGQKFKGAIVLPALPLRRDGCLPVCNLWPSRPRRAAWGKGEGGRRDRRQESGLVTNNGERPAERVSEAARARLIRAINPRLIAPAAATAAGGLPTLCLTYSLPPG